MFYNKYMKTDDYNEKYVKPPSHHKFYLSLK